MIYDYEKLRSAAASEFAIVSVPTIELAELLAEVDYLRTNGATKAQSKYTPEFETAWAAYPARPGNSKAAALKAWNARLKAGATAIEMIDGTMKYAAHVKAERTDPNYIKQAATFYGPGEHFSADWGPRKPPDSTTAYGRGPRPIRPLGDINAANNAEAMRLLDQVNFDLLRTIDEVIL